MDVLRMNLDKHKIERIQIEIVKRDTNLIIDILFPPLGSYVGR